MENSNKKILYNVNEINLVDQGRNDDGPGRLRPCGLIGFRRLVPSYRDWLLFVSRQKVTKGNSTIYLLSRFKIRFLLKITHSCRRINSLRFIMFSEG